MNTGLVGLIVALNLCERVSAYGFVLTNDASYYDDKHSTMVPLSSLLHVPACMCASVCVHAHVSVCATMGCGVRGYMEDGSPDCQDYRVPSSVRTSQAPVMLSRLETMGWRETTSHE